MVVEVVSEVYLPHPDCHPGDAHPHGCFVDRPLRNTFLSADTKNELIVYFVGSEDMYAKTQHVDKQICCECQTIRS